MIQATEQYNDKTFAAEPWEYRHAALVETLDLIKLRLRSAFPGSEKTPDVTKTRKGARIVREIRHAFS